MLVSPGGESFDTAVRQHAVARPWPGHVEMEAQVWWREFVEIATELTASAGVTITAVWESAA